MTPDAAGRPERSDLTVDQHRMVAPSRVWLMPPPGDPTWYAGTWKSNPLTVVVGDVPYVPESRALAAEAERDRYRQQWLDAVEELRAQVAALTAERNALVPLMQAVDAMAWTAGANVPPGIHFTTAKELGEFLSVLNAARRVVEGA